MKTGRKRKYVYVIAVLGLLFVLYERYVVGMPPWERRLAKVKLNMTPSEVVKIMGPPIAMDTLSDDGKKYYYQYINHASGASDDFRIYFSKKDSVVVYVYWGN